MPTDPSPLHTYTLTTAEPFEGAVVGDKSKDWTISLLEERLESRILITNKLEAELASLRAELAKRDEAIGDTKRIKDGYRAEVQRLTSELAKRDETIAEWLKANDQWAAELDRLRKDGDQRDMYAGMLHADVHVMVHAADDLAMQLSEAKATIATLRAELAGTGEAIGDAFGEDASDKEEAFVAGLPTVAEVVAAHDKEMAGATERLAGYLNSAKPGLVEHLRYYSQSNPKYIINRITQTIADIVFTNQSRFSLTDDVKAKVYEAMLSFEEFLPKNATLQANAVEQAEVIAKQAKDMGETLRTLASLRTQLARAGAIEEAAMSYLSLFPEDNIYFPMAKQAHRHLKEVLCSSPSPRDTAEGERRRPENNVGCPSRVSPEAWGQEPCVDCATSFWYPNPDCQRCIDRAKACGQIGDASMVERFASVGRCSTPGEARLAILERVAEAANHLIASVPDWKPGDHLEAALLDGGPIIALACALANLRAAHHPQPKEAL